MSRTELFASLRRSLRIAGALERDRIPTDEALERAAEEAWSRRRFLKTTAAATAAATVAPLMFPRAAHAAGDPRIVILGAGAAGLTAAFRLQQQGLHATILEAAPRVGGRMYSLQNHFPDGQIAELGGELIDSEHHAVRNLAKELGLELMDLTYLDGSNGHDYYVGGRLTKADNDWIEAFRPVAEAIRRSVGEDGCEVDFRRGSDRAKGLDRMSVRQWLDQNGVKGSIRAIIDAAYTGEYGLPLDEQSALNLLCLIGTDDDAFRIFGASDERYRTKLGNGSIPVRLAQALERPVELGTVVEAIRNRGEGYEIAIVRGGTPDIIQADILITTIPLTVMRNLDLARLQLPRLQRDAINLIGYGTNAKMMVGMSARPWVLMNCTAYTFTDLPFQACWESSRGQQGTHAILTNFAGGGLGLKLGEGTLQERAREFVGQVEQVFPGVAAAYTGQAVRQLWPKYEYSLGSYSCFKPGQYQRFYRALEAPQGRLIFAGEHTAAESGFMNSAVESGERAAVAVLGMVGRAARAA
ncbi:MAG: monoamine oxidase [Acidobacteriota bacterium]|jgi:monoamine oxidase|nr:monoamine oxidase [Acidobacteriota bacterium]